MSLGSVKAFSFRVCRQTWVSLEQNNLLVYLSNLYGGLNAGVGRDQSGKHNHILLLFSQMRDSLRQFYKGQKKEKFLDADRSVFSFCYLPVD